jgi:two-component system response regulator AlgR
MSTPAHGAASVELRVYIADDEAPARARLKELLADVRGEMATALVGESANGLEVIERLPASGAQVLLLDIQMPGMGGIELARHLSGLESAPAIVFVTAHDRHAVEAFELNALDYLMKPVRADRLVAALRKALAAGPAPRERLERAAPAAREFFSVAERNRIVLVPAGEVLYLKAELKYVTLRTRAGEHLIEEPLVSIEREFAERFVRVHRNCLVARAAIRGFERLAGSSEEEPHWNVVLEGLDERLPVSRRQWPTLKNVLPEAKE